LSTEKCLSLTSQKKFVMAVINSRTREKGKIIIDYDKCIACGLCVAVCPDKSLEITDGRLHESEKAVFGCIGCGHCMTICPHDAIKIEGRETSGRDLFTLPPANLFPDYDSLYALLSSRRSIRHFKEKEVEQEKIDKILKVASTAPMGIPPSDVQVVVMKGKEKVRAFSEDFAAVLRSSRFIYSLLGSRMMKPFVGKEISELFSNFLNTLVSSYISNMEKGTNKILYDAPLAISFQTTLYTDPADAYIPATYATIAAESLGLGSCMIGGVHPFIKKGAKEFKKKYGILDRFSGGIIVIFGYPKYKYVRGVRRSFKEVKVI